MAESTPIIGSQTRDFNSLYYGQIRSEQLEVLAISAAHHKRALLMDTDILTGWKPVTMFSGVETIHNKSTRATELSHNIQTETNLEKFVSKIDSVTSSYSAQSANRSSTEVVKYGKYLE